MKEFVAECRFPLGVEIAVFVGAPEFVAGRYDFGRAEIAVDGPSLDIEEFYRTRLPVAVFRGGHAAEILRGLAPLVEIGDGRDAPEAVADLRLPVEAVVVGGDARREVIVVVGVVGEAGDASGRVAHEVYALDFRTDILAVRVVGAVGDGGRGVEVTRALLDFPACDVVDSRGIALEVVLHGVA